MAKHDVRLHRRPDAGSGPMTACEEDLAGASGDGVELLDVVVIGGSQAGLAMAWHLARQHLRFVVLEAGPEPSGWRARTCSGGSPGSA
jgi:NADPH-dependent 2,4-dienoyl-CoA reductase/sulfur reductase-like enzyme